MSRLDDALVVIVVSGVFLFCLGFENDSKLLMAVGAFLALWTTLAKRIRYVATMNRLRSERSDFGKREPPDIFRRIR